MQVSVIYSLTNENYYVKLKYNQLLQQMVALQYEYAKSIENKNTEIPEIPEIPEKPEVKNNIDIRVDHNELQKTIDNKTMENEQLRGNIREKDFENDKLKVNNNKKQSYCK